MAIYGQPDGTIFSMKRIIAVTLTVLAVLGLSGSSAQKQSLDGAWRSEGYGMVFDIQGATLKSFEVTATTCVPGDAAQREDTSIDGREATFKTTDCWQLPIARISKRHYASGATTRFNTLTSMRPRDICVSSPSPAIPRSGGLRTD
jgi:hypothetical protein